MLFSCDKEIKLMLKPEYKVIEFYYGFDNYMTNVRGNKVEPFIIKERNYLEIIINEKGEFELEKKMIESNLIVSELKKYLIPNPENKEMPETIEQEFTYAGKVITNKSLFISGIQ